METQTTRTSSSSAATDAWTMYIYSLNSPVSKQKYPKRLAKFFAFAGLPQDISIEEQSKMFVAKAAVAAASEGDSKKFFHCFKNARLVTDQLKKSSRRALQSTAER